MLDRLYNLTSKGLLQALSFILASLLFVLILLNSVDFAYQFGGRVPYLAIICFYGMAILFIHGIGFNIKSKVWQLIFLPLFGYIIVITYILLLIFK